MSASTVHVKNIGSSTSEKEIKEFFSFCGKITSLNVTEQGTTKEATVVFEKETAAKTALLLDQTKLGSNSVSVTHAGTPSEEESYTHNAERDSDEITQEEKPRSRIIAEYLAQGYAIGDQAIQKSIDLDHKHGVSARFLQTLQNLDNKTKATEKAKSVDSQYQITDKATNVAQSVWAGLSTYYEKAVGTPTGSKLAAFYTQQQRQVADIHNEARRLANLKNPKTTVTETGKTSSVDAHSSAIADTSIVDTTKVAPLDPVKQ